MELSAWACLTLFPVMNNRKAVIWMFVLLNIKYELEDLLHCNIDIVRLRENLNIILKKNIKRDGIYV